MPKKGSIFAGLAYLAALLVPEASASSCQPWTMTFRYPSRSCPKEPEVVSAKKPLPLQPVQRRFDKKTAIEPTLGVVPGMRQSPGFVSGSPNPPVINEFLEWKKTSKPGDDARKTILDALEGRKIGPPRRDKNDNNDDEEEE